MRLLYCLLLSYSYRPATSPGDMDIPQSVWDCCTVYYNYIPRPAPSPAEIDSLQSCGTAVTYKGNEVQQGFRDNTRKSSRYYTNQFMLFKFSCQYHELHISCSISESPPHFISFLTVQGGSILDFFRIFCICRLFAVPVGTVHTIWENSKKLDFDPKSQVRDLL